MLTAHAVTTTEKPCRKCGKAFPLDQFPKHRQMADGHLHRCRGCTTVYNQQHYVANRERRNAKSYARYHGNKETISAAARERYATDPAYRQRILDSNKAARDRNPESDRARSLAWYEQNKAKANAASVVRNRAHPAERAEYQRRMRARQKGATVIDLTLGQWNAILDAHDHACHYCGSRDDIGMDHRIPCQRGGGHTASNVVPCCRSCNTSKGIQTPEEWARGWLAVA